MSKPAGLTGESVLAHLHKRGIKLDVDFLREAMQAMAQMLIELEVSTAIEADPYERSDKRRAYRNGYRRRNWRTSIGDIPLQIPKLRQGTYYPQVIENLPEAESLLLAAVLDSFVYGADVEPIGNVLHHFGFSDVQPNQIADMTERLDDLIESFRQRPLNAEYGTLRLEVIPLQARQGERTIRFEVAVAAGEQPNGRREILGFEVTPRAEGWDFWTGFFGNLTGRGLENVDVITADSQRDGLRQAVRETFHTATFRWQSPEASIRLPEARLSVTIPVISMLNDDYLLLAPQQPILLVERLVGLALMMLHMGWAVSYTDEMLIAA